jgi:hypothetical protein
MSLTRRAARLTAVLILLPLCLLHPAARQAIGRARLEGVVFWGLPVAAMFFAALLFPRLPASTGRPTTWRTALRLAPFCGLALLADFSYLGVGHLLDWVTFTFGDQQLSGHPGVAVARGLPLCLLVGVIGWERALRGGVLSGWAGTIGTLPAAAISVVAGVALASPGILLGTAFYDAPYVAAAFAVAACHEIAYSIIFLSGGGLLLAGLTHGLLYFLEGFVITDVNSLFFPLSNYTTSEPRFYLLRGGAALAGAAVVAAGAWWARRAAAAAPGVRQPR